MWEKVAAVADLMAQGFKVLAVSDPPEEGDIEFYVVLLRRGEDTVELGVPPREWEKFVKRSSLPWDFCTPDGYLGD